MPIIAVLVVIGGFFVYQNMGLITNTLTPVEKTLVNTSQKIITDNTKTKPNPTPANTVAVTQPITPTCQEGFKRLPDGSCLLDKPLIVPNSPPPTSSPQQTTPQVTTPQQTSQTDSIQAINNINTKRVSDGKNPITFDTRVFNLAIARAKDMYDYGYLDHTNPQTGTCPYTMKSQFGLSASEDVAENAYEIGYKGTRSLFNPSLTDVIDSWMGSTGHRMNLLFYGHTAGAVACYGNYCAFEGLNQNQFGHGCSTAKEGQAYASRFVNCTPDQMHQFDALNQQYDALSKQYDSFPKTATSDAEYQRDTQMYNQLQGLYNQITNFKC